MKRFRAGLLALLFVLLGGIIIWQQRVVSQLQAEIASARSQGVHTTERLVATPEVDDQELKKSRDEHAELLRLRGEVTRMQKSAKKEQVIATPVSAPNTATFDETANPLTVSTNFTVTLQNKETSVTGGWETAAGRNTFVLITPEFEDDKQITLTSQFVEVPDANVAALNTETGKISAADYEKFLKGLEGTPGGKTSRSTTGDDSQRQARSAFHRRHSRPRFYPRDRKRRIGCFAERSGCRSEITGTQINLAGQKSAPPSRPGIPASFPFQAATCKAWI